MEDTLRYFCFVFSFFDEIVTQGNEIEADNGSEAHPGNHGDGERALELRADVVSPKQGDHGENTG